MIDTICTIKKLGCYTHCGNLVLPLVSQYSDIHICEFNWLGNTHIVKFAALEGQTFEIPNKFNERAITNFKILQPDSSYFSITENEEEISRFSVDTSVSLDLTDNCTIETLIAECVNTCDCEPIIENLVNCKEDSSTC